MTGDGGLVEVQATAERTPLARAHLDDLLALAAQGIAGLRAAQDLAIAAGARVKLVLATRNAHKLRELSLLLVPHELEPLPVDVVLPPETGATFAENALARRAPPPSAPAADDRRRLGDRGRGARRRPRRALGALRRPGRDRRGQPRAPARRGAGRRARCATSACSPSSTRERRGAHLRGLLQRRR